jgi:hypothetical protein
MQHTSHNVADGQLYPQKHSHRKTGIKLQEAAVWSCSALATLLHSYASLSGILLSVADVCCWLGVFSA